METNPEARKVKKLASLYAKRAGVIPSLWLLAFLSFLQFICGIVSLVGFGLQGFTNYVREETFVGKVFEFISYTPTGMLAGFLFDFDVDAPFEVLGGVFLVLVIIISLIIFVGYSIYILYLDQNPFGSVVAFAASAAALWLNISVGTSWFPWLGIWALFWISRAMVAPVTSALSSTK